MSIRDVLVAGVVRVGKAVLRIPSRNRMASFVSAELGAHSQYGEDLMVDAVLGCRLSGFYVDIGANHPTTLNNTRRFYDRGWRGISVEPNPDLHALLVADRPSDINVNVGIGPEEGTLPFYRLMPDVYSTFDKAIADQSTSDYPGTVIADVVQVEVVTMRALLGRYVPEATAIDFLSLDVEGGELTALRSNDWSRWRPRLVMVEFGELGAELVAFMEDRGYHYSWSNGTNGLFLDCST